MSVSTRGCLMQANLAAFAKFSWERSPMLPVASSSE
jgi:hypothetical protein